MKSQPFSSVQCASFSTYKDMDTKEFLSLI